MPVLYIRDGNGKFVPIPSIRGSNGKSAYEQAKEGGYNGTEEEFIVLLNSSTAHWVNYHNPHNVTKEQLGLSNVDNTSDTIKPVSLPQASAIAEAKRAGTDAQSYLNSHIENKSNPHGVTVEQIGAAPAYTYGTDDLTPGESELETGQLYFVYE